MKKIKLLIITIFVSLTAFSQVVTDTNRLSISHAVAKAIAKDLVKCDSTSAILKLKEEEVTLLEKKVSLKDSVLNHYRMKELNYQYQIQNESAKVKGWEDQYKKLQAEYKRLQVKHKFTKIVSLAIIGGLSYLYVTK